MSAGDAPSGTAGLQAQSPRESLWAIGLGALLVAAGLARRPADPRSRRDDHADAPIGGAGLQKGLPRSQPWGGRTYCYAYTTAFRMTAFSPTPPA